MPYDSNGYPDISVPDLGRVFQAVRDGNCIPFFGAGASMDYVFNGASGSGIAGGWELTLALLREAGVATPGQIAVLKDPAAADPAALRDAINFFRYDLLKAADAYLYSRANNRAKLDQFLRQEVARARSPRPIHTVVAQLLDIYTVLTTNYDCLFELACKTYDRDLLKHVHDQRNERSAHWRVTPNLKKPQIILHKMHGSEERDDTMIITRADYIRYLATWRDENKGMPRIVYNRIPSSTVLFLGYGLADWNLLTIWEGVVSSYPQGGDETQSFAVMKSVSDQDRQFFQKRNIEVVVCDLTHFAIALAREFKLEIPQLGIPIKPSNAGGVP